MSVLILINGEEDFLIERAARDEAQFSFADEILQFWAPKDIDKYIQESSCSVIGNSRRAFIIWDATVIPPLPENKPLSLHSRGVCLLRPCMLVRRIP